MKTEKTDELTKKIDAEVEKRISAAKDEKEIEGIKSIGSFLKRSHLDADFRADMTTLFQNIRKDVGAVEKSVKE
jgi:hypothetical protein